MKLYWEIVVAALSVLDIFLAANAEIASFPSGYKYMSQAEAWFKVHTSGASWGDASLVCNREGDNQYKHALNDSGKLENVSQIKILPYICYKKGSQDDGYTYDYRTNKCHKFYREESDWYAAGVTCSKDYGRLAIINSKVEGQVIRELFERNPENTISSKWKNLAFAGYRKLNNKWVTLTGQSLEERLSKTDYEGWHAGEPTNFEEYCGAVARDGTIYDACCNSPLSFICEQKPERCQEFDWSSMRICACA